MRFLCTIYTDESSWGTMTPEDGAAQMKAYNEFTEAIRKAGVLVSGDGLQPTATATTIRERDGERVLTDGPFAETKEQLGGFYLLECASKDEAVDWASKIPAVQSGSVEVRPVMDYPEDGEPAAAQPAEARA
jgi:hypothetical protein